MSSQKGGGHGVDLIAHLIALEEWFALDPDVPYRPASLVREGFVHCSLPAQVARSANVHFASHEALILVWFEAARLEQLVMEATSTVEPFPHVYAPLDLGDAHHIELLERSAGEPFRYGVEGEAAREKHRSCPS